MKLIGARQADCEPGIGKALFDLGALGLGQRELDAVLVRGAKLDVLEFRFPAVLDEGWDIPALPDLVRHQAKFQGLRIQGERVRRLTGRNVGP
jgi:hypothetical protein